MFIIIPFLKDGVALQVFVKCNLIRHKLEVYATNKRHKLEVYATNKEIFSIRNGISESLADKNPPEITLFVLKRLLTQFLHGSNHFIV